MTKNQLIVQSEILLCKSNDITSKRQIARSLMEKYPDMWKSYDSARSAVKNILGGHGKQITKPNQATFDAYKAGMSTDYDRARIRPTVKAKHYIITSAVNNTPVFKPFWDNLLAYVEFLGAELYVIAVRYSNPTSIFSDAKEDFWCPDVLKYLDANRHMVHKTIEIMSDVKIIPTATNPLNGMEGLSGDASCIFGSPRVHMKFLPVPKGSAPKIMMTTGACTMASYTDSAVGKKGDFHHVFGFNIVSIQDDDVAMMRYVTASSDGSFIDLDLTVDCGIVVNSIPPLAMVLGDIHCAKLTKEGRNRMYSVIDDFHPECVVMHDVFDGESINPHEMDNPIQAHKMFVEGRNILSNEIDNTVAFVKIISDLCPKVVIVNSNHDYFLDRYIANFDWKKDVTNAITYTALAFKALCGDATKGLFAKIVEERLPEVICLDIDESFKVDDIELGYHGHLGSNGSRGSIIQYRKLSTRCVIGHGHSPSRLDGVDMVGCQELSQGYNKGMSSWGLADLIINSDGKRQHIIYFGNKYKI